MFPAPYPKVRANKIVAPSLYEATDAIASLSLEPSRKASLDAYAFSRVSAGRFFTVYAAFFRLRLLSSPDQMTQSIILDGSDGWQAYVLGRRLLNHEEIMDIRPGL